jgi:hypothetical protein
MSQTNETTFAYLIAALGKAAGVADLAAPDDAIVRMEVDGQPVSIIRQGETAILYCSPGVLPADANTAERVRTLLLSANVLYRGTHGACLGLSPEDGIISLCYQFPLHGVTEGAFVSAVENYLALAEHWVKRLEDCATVSTETAPTEIEATPSNSWLRA